MNFALLGIGTNLGNKQRNIETCFARIKAFALITHISSIYRVSALLPHNAPPAWNIDFLNLVISINTTLSVHQLLHHLKNVEKTMGRNLTAQKWSPRIIDIDILFYNNLVMQNNALTVPHPEIHKRKFVLEPLAEIAPNIMHPVLKKTAKTLLLQLQSP